MAIGRQNPEDELRPTDSPDDNYIAPSDPSPIEGAGTEDPDVDSRLDEVTR